MAVIGNTYLTLKDKLAQTENGKAATAIVDLLAQSNALIEDAIVRECNEGSTHKTTVRNGLPEVEFRKYFTLWWEVLLKSLRGNPYKF